MFLFGLEIFNLWNFADFSWKVTSEDLIHNCINTYWTYTDVNHRLIEVKFIIKFVIYMIYISVGSVSIDKIMY